MPSRRPHKYLRLLEALAEWIGLFATSTPCLVESYTHFKNSKNQETTTLCLHIIQGGSRLIKTNLRSIKNPGLRDIERLQAIDGVLISVLTVFNLFIMKFSASLQVGVWLKHVTLKSNFLILCLLWVSVKVILVIWIVLFCRVSLFLNFPIISLGLYMAKTWRPCSWIINS